MKKKIRIVEWAKEFLERMVYQPVLHIPVVWPTANYLTWNVWCDKCRKKTRYEMRQTLGDVVVEVVRCPKCRNRWISTKTDMFINANPLDDMSVPAYLKPPKRKIDIRELMKIDPQYIPITEESKTLPLPLSIFMKK